MLLTNILKTATTRRHVLIFKHTKNKLNYTNTTTTTSGTINNNYLINNNIYSLTTRHFSEAKAEDDGFFGRFKSMFSGANTSSNVDEEGGGKKKKQTVMGGFREGFNNKLEERQAKQETEQFHFFYDELVKAKEFDSLAYLKITKELMKQGGADGIRGKIASATGIGKKELAIFKANVEILENFKRKELSEVGYLNIMSKRRVMKDTGHSLDQINQVCKNYFDIKMLHNWVQKHHGSGGERPASMKEAHQLIKQEGDLEAHLAAAWGGAHGRKKMMKKARKQYMRSMKV